MKLQRINEYEAALRFDLSPTLLRWLTSNSIIDKTKLKYEEHNNIYYYNIDDLIALNKKMEGKWPKNTSGKRPNIPEGIKREVKAEACHSCPVCNKSYGEVAHIDPVSATHCNHPKNLIYLCPNHHTEYDNALIHSNIEREEVLTLKKGLLIFQRTIWKIQGKTINSYLGVLNTAKSLLNIHTSIERAIPDGLFKETLAKIANSTHSNSKIDINNKDKRNIDIINQEINNYI